jgi:hypothetical protein
VRTADDEIRHRLVSYDPARREATVQEFGTDYDGALDHYARAERQALGTDLDVVLLSTDSLETVKRTHSTYFSPGGSRSFPWPKARFAPNPTDERTILRCSSPHTRHTAHQGPLPLRLQCVRPAPRAPWSASAR